AFVDDRTAGRYRAPLVGRGGARPHQGGRRLERHPARRGRRSDPTGRAPLLAREREAAGPVSRPGNASRHLGRSLLPARRALVARRQRDRGGGRGGQRPDPHVLAAAGQASLDRGRRDHRQRLGHARGLRPRPPLPPVPDDQAGRRRPRPLHREPDRPPPRRQDPRPERRRGGDGRAPGLPGDRGGPVTQPARPQGRGLILEGEPAPPQQLEWALKSSFEVEKARDAPAGRALLETNPEVLLFDLRLPPSGTIEEGFGLIAAARQRDPDATIVVMSGEEDRKAALRAIAAGAFDFFKKPVDAAELRLVLTRALERRRLLLENRELKEAAVEPRGLPSLVGASAPMRRLLSEIDRIAPTDATVLIIGESGTGKELVAHAIHDRSLRRQRPFVAVNASALPESLAESELFGHEKGAFTGAISSRPGRFELASGGTLFLDEIGTLSAAVQAKLLRAIESREIERVGGRRSIPVDF